MTKQQIKSDGGSTSYYDLPPAASQLGDLIEHKNMNFNVGTIFKAAYRLGEKAGFDAAYDLRKIIWSAQRELARVEAAQPKPHNLTYADFLGRDDPAPFKRPLICRACGVAEGVEHLASCYLHPLASRSPT